MIYGVALFRNNTYKIYEKPRAPKYNSELIYMLIENEPDFQQLIICTDYRARGFDGDVIPYKQWSIDKESHDEC